MRPFKGRFRIRGTFSRTRAGERFVGRGRGSQQNDTENVNREGRPRSHPLFYPDDRHEVFAPSLYDEHEERHANPLEERYGEHGRVDYSHRYESRSRSPSPYDKYHRDQRRRSRSRSRYRSRSRSRSKSRSPSYSRSKRGRSDSRSPRRRQSPSYSPRRRTNKSRYRSRSRTPDSYRKESHDVDLSPMTEFRETRRVEKSERTVDAVQSINNSPERSLRVTVGNFKRDDRSYKSMKSPAEDMFLDRKRATEKMNYHDSPKHSDRGSPRRSHVSPKRDIIRYNRESPRRERDSSRRGEHSPQRGHSSPQNDIRRDHDSPRRDSRDESPTCWPSVSSEALKRHGDSKEALFKEAVMKERFSIRDEFRDDPYTEISVTKSKESEYVRGRMVKESSRSPSPSHSRLNRIKGLKSPPWYDSPSRSHDSMLDSKPVKSILKKKTLQEEESDSHSSLIAIPGLSVEPSIRTFSGTTIPGLGDMDAIEDEEKYLYGDETEEPIHKNTSSSYEKEIKNRSYLHNIDDGSRSPLSREIARNRKHTEYFSERREQDDFRNFRESPSRNLRSSSPSMHRELSFKGRFEPSESPERTHYSPYHSHRLESHLDDDLSPRLAETLSRSQYLLRKRKSSDDSDFSDYLRNRDKYIDKDIVKGGNRKLEDVLKSMGFDFNMVKKFQENHSAKEFSDIHSPTKDIAKEASELYGIKPEMQTSSFFETCSKPTLKRDSLSLQTNTTLNEQENTTLTTHQQYPSTPTQPINPYLSVSNDPQYAHQHQGNYSQFNYQTGTPSADPYSYPNAYMMNPPYAQSTSQPMQVNPYNENSGRSNLKVIPLQTNISSPSTIKPINTMTTTTGSNLKQIPLTSLRHEEKPQPTMSNVQKMINNALKSSLRPQTNLTFQEKETEQLVKSVKDVQFLMNRREKQYKKLALLEKELCHLAKQQGELMRKKQKQKDGHKDPLLLENNKLQEEISREINQTRMIIEETTDLLKGSDFFLKSQQMKEEKPPEQVLQPSPPVVQSHPPPVPSLPPPVERNEAEEHETECEYTDSGNHWCKICNEFFPNLSKWFSHLQCKEHYQNIDPSDLVVMSEAFKPPKQTVTKQSQKRLVSAIKGVQFLVPAASFYCKLCTEFLGNNASAEYHLRSKEHNFKYLKFVLENPMYERKWNADKMTSLTVKAEEVKRKRVEQDREREEKRKKRLVEAEMRNKELIKAEAERNKHVELDESPKVSSSSLKPESSKGKEIKLTLKMEKKASKDSLSSNEESGFGKFTWKKDSEKKEEASPKIEEKEPPAINTASTAQKPGSRIAIRLSGKTIIPPSIPWQTVSKGGPQNSSSLKQIQRTSVTAFPLRKGKNDPLPDKNSSMDIFSSTELSSGKNGKSASSANEGKGGSGFAPSQIDIAKAFVGKFETKEDSDFSKRLKSENIKDVVSQEKNAADSDHSDVDLGNVKINVDGTEQELQKNVGEFDKIPLSSASFISTFVNTDKVSSDNNSILSVNNQKKKNPQATAHLSPSQIKVKEDKMASHEETSAGNLSSSVPIPSKELIFYGPQLPESLKIKDETFQTDPQSNLTDVSKTNIKGVQNTDMQSNKAYQTITNPETGITCNTTEKNSSKMIQDSLTVDSDNGAKNAKSVPIRTMTDVVSVSTKTNSFSSSSSGVKSQANVKTADIKKYIPKGPSNVVCDYIMKSLANSTLKIFSDSRRKSESTENIKKETKNEKSVERDNIESNPQTINEQLTYGNKKDDDETHNERETSEMKGGNIMSNLCDDAKDYLKIHLEQNIAKHITETDSFHVGDEQHSDDLRKQILTNDAPKCDFTKCNERKHSVNNSKETSDEQNVQHLNNASDEGNLKNLRGETTEKSEGKAEEVLVSPNVIFSVSSSETTEIAYTDEISKDIGLVKYSENDKKNGLDDPVISNINLDGLPLTKTILENSYLGGTKEIQKTIENSKSLLDQKDSKSISEDFTNDPMSISEDNPKNIIRTSIEENMKNIQDHAKKDKALSSVSGQNIKEFISLQERCDTKERDINKLKNSSLQNITKNDIVYNSTTLEENTNDKENFEKSTLARGDSNLASVNTSLNVDRNKNDSEPIKSPNTNNISLEVALDNSVKIYANQTVRIEEQGDAKVMDVDIPFDGSMMEKTPDVKKCLLNVQKDVDQKITATDTVNNRLASSPVSEKVEENTKKDVNINSEEDIKKNVFLENSPEIMEMENNSVHGVLKTEWETSQNIQKMVQLESIPAENYTEKKENLPSPAFKESCKSGKKEMMSETTLSDNNVYETDNLPSAFKINSDNSRHQDKGEKPFEKTCFGEEVVPNEQEVDFENLKTDIKENTVDRMEEELSKKVPDSSEAVKELNRIKILVETSKVDCDNSKKEDKGTLSKADNDDKAMQMEVDDSRGTRNKENLSDADSEESGVSIDLQMGSDMIVLDETIFDTD